MAARVALATVLAGALLSCRNAAGDPSWISADTAVAVCVVAGPQLVLPPLAGELPVPVVPTGLYTRGLDPRSLDNLGYARDSVVCATLEAPPLETIARGRTGALSLAAARDEASSVARSEIGSCACEVARVLGRKAWLSGCSNFPTTPSCEVTESQLARVAELTAPIEQAFPVSSVPPIHWRVFGTTDRPGWFLEHATEFFVRHPGGSELFVHGQADLPEGIVRLLLSVSSSVAVIRQDGGRAYMVVREFPTGTLIFDHFSMPVGVDSMTDLLDEWWATQTPQLFAALGPPRFPQPLALDPRDGTVMAIAREPLERVDASLVASIGFSGQVYDEDAEIREMPPALVDRMEMRIPYGRKGEVLEMRMELGASGRIWAQGLPPGEISTLPVDGFGVATQLPHFESPMVVPFVLRGQPTEAALLAFPHGLYRAVPQLSRQVPSPVAGHSREFRVEIPAGPLLGEYNTPDGLAMLRTRLSVRAHILTSRLSDEGVLTLQLVPR